MKLKHALIPLALAGLMILVAAPAAQASSGSITYALQGTETTTGTGLVPPNCAILDALGCPVSAQGTASCSGCPAGAPTSGAFVLRFTSYVLFPPNPCRVKSMEGTLSVTWSDGRFTTGSVTGTIRDDKQRLSFDGTTDPSSTAFPPNPWKGTLIGFPPAPICTASSGPTSGTLVFYPPDPI